MSDTPRRAVYPGSFDPFHLGHENIARRASRLFDELIIGVGYNPEKALSKPEERVSAIQAVVKTLPNVRVIAFRGLAVDFVREQKARFMVRGIRALADMEYEFTMSLTNAMMAPEIETVFLMAGKEYTNLSSTLIRQIAKYRGDLSSFLPEPIIDTVRQSLARPET